MSVGCRIRRNFERPAKELVEAFRGIPVANIDDNCGRIAAVDASIYPLNPKARLLGTAFTVNAPAGDNLLFHKALDMAQPGDVIVLANKGSMSRALCGEIMSSYAKSRGLAGIIIDGCVRDSYTLSQMDFPVYAKGVTPQRTVQKRTWRDELPCFLCRNHHQSWRYYHRRFRRIDRRETGVCCRAGGEGKGISCWRGETDGRYSSARRMAPPLG